MNKWILCLYYNYSSHSATIHLLPEIIRYYDKCKLFIIGHVLFYQKFDVSVQIMFKSTVQFLSS